MEGAMDTLAQLEQQGRIVATKTSEFSGVAPCPQVWDESDQEAMLRDPDDEQPYRHMSAR
jgi:hypothetical protein